MSVVLYQLPHSPYVIPIRQALTACGVAFETRDVPNWDRSEIIRQTNGAYYQVPLLVHEGKAVFESRPDSLDVAHYVDATWAQGKLFPAAMEAANLCLTQWIEDALEGCAFRLCDIHYVPSIEDLVARTMVIRHKERRFGRGCVEEWQRNAAAIRAEFDGMLSRFETTLRVSPFLLGPTPVYADFALLGVLGNFLYRGWNELSGEQRGLAEFVKRLTAWRF